MELARPVAPLFVPADRPDRFGKAMASGADAIIIDLEDAVAPAGKIAARDGLASSIPRSGAVIVRINDVASPWFEADLACALSLPLAAIMLPKADARAVRAVAERSDRRGFLVALVETARGLDELRQLSALAPVGQLALGTYDLCLELAMSHTRTALAHARWDLVLASRLANLPAPLDGVTADFNDAAIVADDARYAAELGFGGRLCIHPAQIEPTLRGLLPGEADLARATRLEAASRAGAGAVDGAMVDRPVLERATALLKRHAHISGLLERLPTKRVPAT